MVFQLMLHFVFEEDELKATPVTGKRLIYLRQKHKERVLIDDYCVLRF